MHMCMYVFQVLGVDFCTDIQQQKMLVYYDALHTDRIKKEEHSSRPVNYNLTMFRFSHLKLF